MENFLRVVAKSLSMVSLNIANYSAIFNYIEILLLMVEIISMTLEGKEMVFFSNQIWQTQGG